MSGSSLCNCTSSLNDICQPIIVIIDPLSLVLIYFLTFWSLVLFRAVLRGVKEMRFDKKNANWHVISLKLIKSHTCSEPLSGKSCSTTGEVWKSCWLLEKFSIDIRLIPAKARETNVVWDSFSQPRRGFSEISRKSLSFFPEKIFSFLKTMFQKTIS